MKKRQMALMGEALRKAANDEEFPRVTSTTRSLTEEESPAETRSGWDPFEVWRTRIKPARRSGRLEK